MIDQIGLPPREVCLEKGWKYQINYMYDNKPCMIRVKSKQSKDTTVDVLCNEGYCVEVIDLEQALKLV